MLIIGISGKIGSGKDYIAREILRFYREKNKNVLIICFADYLKILCISKDNIPYSRVFVSKDTESRRILQVRGDIERDQDPSIFCKVLENYLKLYEERGVDVVIIPDVRFKNEYNSLRKYGAIIIRINSPRRTRDKMINECAGDESSFNSILIHKSETELDDEKKFDFIIKNDYEDEESIPKIIESMLTGI